MKLVLIRHLPTEWNREGRLQGQRDTDILPPDSAACAEKARELTALGPFDHIACSALRRTRQTAEAFGFTAEPDALLNELNFGEWEGRPRAEMIAAHGGAWHHAPQTLVFGEAVGGMAERIRAFVAKHREKTRVLAFGHGGWIRAARALHTTGELATMNAGEVGNSAIVTLEW